MTLIIKCDQMLEDWNYDTCWECKRYNWSKTKKGSNWTCSLNNKSAAEKRTFYMIWAENYLIERGMLGESLRRQITVEYVGKKRRERKKHEV